MESDKYDSAIIIGRDSFDQECWHIQTQFGNGNYRQCLKCKKVADYIYLFHCAHCNDMKSYSDYWISNNNIWLVDPEDYMMEYLVNDIYYTCSICKQISINPVRKTIINWINPITENT